MLPVLPRHPRSDYIDAPASIKKRTPAGRRGWFPGWPEGVPAFWRTTVTVGRKSPDPRTFKLTCDKRLAELWIAFATYIQDVGLPLIGADELNVNGKKQGGVGSYFNRAIKHSDPPKPSNHSSGTAIDLWTRSNPMLIRGTGVPFVSTIHPFAVELAAAAGIFWGGWYYDESKGNYVDAMHFEYMKRPEDVPQSLADLKAKYDEIKKQIEPEPEDPPPVDAEDVKLIQSTLNTLGATPPLVVDGDFGPLTRAAIEALPGKVAAQVTTAESAAEAETRAQVKQEAQAAISNL